MLKAILQGLGISMILLFSVGPVIFAIIKQSITNGRAGGFSFVAGVWASDLLWVILSNAFSQLVSELLSIQNTISFVGSLFLIGMGVFFFFFKKQKLRSEQEASIKITSGTHARLALSGFLINTLNPAVILFWLTTATALSLNNSVQDRVIIFSTCLILNMSADALKVILAGKLRDKLTDRIIGLINRFSGLLFMIFGLVLMINVFYSIHKR
ncbi:MAG TPA: LysE family transporter [Ferruginibacter sp.]|jgi:threonine/homoserine/homoserine lactone efflux protein|nr:LysE family transporter [Ferruginibacter sp.]